MPRLEEVDAVKEWLRHPVTKVFAGKLRAASRGALRRYDKATPDEVLRIQLLREVLNETIPAVLEVMLQVEGEPKSKFDWRKLLGIKPGSPQR